MPPLSGKASQSTRALVPNLSERGFKILVLDQRWILGIKRQWPLISEEDVSKKKCRAVSRTETSPTEVSSGPGTRHPHRVTLSYFVVTACFIKILFPLQKASVIIHSAFPPFASCYFPRQTDSIPHLNQMAASWSWWRLIETMKLSIQRRLVFLPFFPTHSRSFANSNKNRNMKQC